MRQGGFSTLGMLAIGAVLIAVVTAEARAEEAPPAEPAANVAPSAPAASPAPVKAPRPDPAPTPKPRPAKRAPAPQTQQPTPPVQPPAPAATPPPAPAAAPPAAPAARQEPAPARRPQRAQARRRTRVAAPPIQAMSPAARLAAIEPELRSVEFRTREPMLTLEKAAVPRLFVYAGIALLAGSLLLLALASLPPQVVPWPGVYHALELRRHAFVVFAAASFLEVALIFVLFGWEGS